MQCNINVKLCFSPSQKQSCYKTLWPKKMYRTSFATKQMFKKTHLFSTQISKLSQSLRFLMDNYVILINFRIFCLKCTKCCEDRFSKSYFRFPCFGIRLSTAVVRNYGQVSHNYFMTKI